MELDVDHFLKNMESVMGHVPHEKAVHDTDNEEGSTSSSEMDVGTYCFLFCMISLTFHVV